MNPDKKLLEDDLWIASKRFRYNLRHLLRRYPEGAPDRVAAQALMVTEDEVEEIYQDALAQLRALVSSL